VIIVIIIEEDRSIVVAPMTKVIARAVYKQPSLANIIGLL
jgi:hypothetical protein